MNMYMTTVLLVLSIYFKDFLTFLDIMKIFTLILLVYTEHGLGPERSKQISPLKLLTQKKVPIALHSDFAMAPAQPLFLMWTAIERQIFRSYCHF